MSNVPKSDFQSRFSMSKIIGISLKKILWDNINLGAHFLFLAILCSIKIERLLFLKFLKNLTFFDSYFWPSNKTHKKIIAIFVISAIKASMFSSNSVDLMKNLPLGHNRQHYQ